MAGKRKIARVLADQESDLEDAIQCRIDASIDYHNKVKDYKTLFRKRQLRRFVDELNNKCYD